MTPPSEAATGHAVILLTVGFPHLPHEVQVWWTGRCNCDGHLN